MITPPASVKSYYLVNVKDHLAVSAMSNVLSGASHISSITVLSKDCDSDVEATIELQSVVQKLLNEADSHLHSEIKFNPLYMPHTADIEDVDLDIDGEVVSVAGFLNPYISAEVTANSGSTQLVDGKVCFQTFDLPTLEDALKGAPHRIN